MDNLKKTIIGLGATATVMGGIDASVLNETPIQRVEMIANERVEAKQIGNVVETTLPWKGEAGIKIKYDLGEATVAEKLKDKRDKEVITETVDFGDGGFKIDVLLEKNPDTNVFCYQIENAENYDFFYQPPLTLEEIANGDNRPPEIVGSYAVYHKTLANHVVGKENYATGKVMHIPRPQVWELNDKENTTQWADLSYSDGSLCVTAPQDFLDKAKYPVRIDPTFGYTSAGGSFQRTTETLSQPSANRIGDSYLLATAGTLDSITGRLKMEASSDSAVTCSAFLNYKDSIGTGSHGEIVQIERTNVSLTTTATNYTFTASSEAFTASDIIVNMVCDEGTLTGGLAFGTAYDTVGSTERYDVNTEELYSTTATANPWVATLISGTTNRYTLYATYTAAPSGSTSFAENFEDGSALPQDFDGNGSYGSGSDFALDSTSKVNGTYSARCDIGSAGSACNLYENMVASSTYYIQMSVFLPTGYAIGGSGYHTLFTTGDGVGSPVYCSLEDYGTVRITCNGDEVGYTNTGIDIPLNTITQLEFKIKIGASTGDIDIWIDNNTEGSPDYNGSGTMNTGTENITYFDIGGYHPDVINDMYYDDICAGATFFGGSCFPELPTVTTNPATATTTTTATLNGNITADGGGSIIQHGFAWGTNATLSGGDTATTTLGATSTGAFYENLSSLTAATTYYFRAYAVNSTGTSTGSIETFTTGASSGGSCVGLDFSFLQATNDTTDLSTYTFASQNFGAADTDRYIIIGAVARKAGAATTISSVTIGGVTATEVTSLSNSDSNSNIAGMYIANVPTGTSGDIEIVYGATMVRSAIQVYRVVGLDSPTPYFTDTSTASDPTSSINVPAGGFAVASAISNAESSATWTGLTENWDNTLETFVTVTSASDEFATEQTDLTVTADFASSGSTPVGTFASWGCELGAGTSGGPTSTMKGGLQVKGGVIIK